MANVETREGWADLGHFRSRKCKKTMGVTVCELKFSEGTFTTSKEELKLMAGKK